MYTQLVERRDSANWAKPEKAYLNACYFYYKGKKFSFDLGSDVDLSRLDIKRIESYLSKFDKRFVTYFTNKF